MGLNLDEVLSETTIARLHELVGDRTDAVVGVATPEAEIVWASPIGAEGVFGRQQGEFEHHSQYEYIHPDDRGVFRRQLERATRGETVRYVVRAQSADGSWVRISCVAWAVTRGPDQLIVSIAVPVDADDVD